uniref:Uncharacterized protein n=1 Tax=Oryza punctata TaxID=4537 RepID=A0A0E0KJ13_ORYPU
MATEAAPEWVEKGDNAWQLVGLQSVPGLVILHGGVVEKKWADGEGSNREAFPPNNILDDARRSGAAVDGGGRGSTAASRTPPTSTRRSPSGTRTSARRRASWWLVRLLLDSFFFGRPSVIGDVQSMITGLVVCIAPAAGLVQRWAAMLMVAPLSGSVPWFTIMVLHNRSPPPGARRRHARRAPHPRPGRQPRRRPDGGSSPGSSSATTRSTSASRTPSGTAAQARGSGRSACSVRAVRARRRQQPRRLPHDGQSRGVQSRRDDMKDRLSYFGPEKRSEKMGESRKPCRFLRG